MRIVAIVFGGLLSSAVHAQAPSTPAAAYICDGITNAAEHRQCLDKAGPLTREPDSTAAKETPAPLSFLFQFGPVAIWWIIYYGFGLVIGRYIYLDAKKREWVFLGIRPVWWAILAIFDPALGLIAYWATHYSKFAQTYVEATAPAAKS